MNKKTIILILILFSWFNSDGQIIDSLNQEASPIGGINQLAIKYYGIDFTKEQRQKIKDIEIEFIFSIDEFGNPTLSEINGIKDTEILDSLVNKTDHIENFNPRIRNGIAEPSIYFMKLTFPSYKFTQQKYGLLLGATYNEAKIEDFEYLNESGQRLDMIIGGFANQFIGNPAKYLKIGGGMKIDINFTAKNKIFYGLNMSFAQNGLKKDYPINSPRDQNVPITGFVGLTIGKWFRKFNIQGDLDLAVHNVTEKMGNNDNDWVQFEGWSPGLIINFPILLGKQKPLYYYGAPTLFENYLNLHLGIRYVKYPLKEASGIMAEIGVSYRMTAKIIDRYKLKDEFLNK